MDKNTSFIAVAVVTATLGFAANADNPAERAGDPSRWYIPADTPAQKYVVAMKEAGAALKEAQQECRQLKADAAERKACEAEARGQWQHEIRQARAHLSGESAAPKQQ